MIVGSSRIDVLSRRLRVGVKGAAKITWTSGALELSMIGRGSGDDTVELVVRQDAPHLEGRVGFS